MGRYPLTVNGRRRTLPAMSRFAVALATVDDFAERTGAERVMALLDEGEDASPVLVERLEDGRLQVTEGDEARTVQPDPTVVPMPLPDLRAVPASALAADP